MKRMAAILVALLLSAGIYFCAEILIFNDKQNNEDVTGSEEQLPDEMGVHEDAVSGISDDQGTSAEELEALKPEEILANMSLEEKVGQLFFVQCPIKDAVSDIKSYDFGGLLLFAYHFENETAESAAAKIEGYQINSGVPMLIGVDEEGGAVTRISLHPQFGTEKFKSPQELFAEGGLERIRADAADKTEFLQKLGINVNLAPVCDVSEAADDYMYSRSFGKDAVATAEYAQAVVSEMAKRNMGSVLKHFPGYGNNADTHTSASVDTRTYSDFENADFLPFMSGIAAGDNTTAVMVSHNTVTAIDADNPASLSEKMHDVLRQRLGFDGVIITDDLTMSAVADFTDGETAAVLAVLAGNDMIICSDYRTQIPAVIDAVRRGVIPEERVNESVMRVLQWKLRLGIM